MIDKERDDSLPNKLKMISTKVKQGAKSAADTANILSSVHELLNECFQDPEGVHHDHWEFLANNLNDLHLGAGDIEKFLTLRERYDVVFLLSTEQEKKNKIKDFQKMLRNLMGSARSIADILVLKGLLSHHTMSDGDLRECLSIVRIGMKDKKAAGERETFEELGLLLETALAKKLFEKYSGDPESIPFKDFYFINQYWYNHNNTKLDFDTDQLDLLGDLVSVRKHVDLPSYIDRLFKKTDQTLQKFVKLASTGYPMPENTYNPAKTGGFADLSVDGDYIEKRQIGDGPILTQEDAKYETNGIKYSRHATQKVFQLFAHPDKKYSEETPLGIAGGVTFDYHGKQISFSYSGGTPAQDQAIVIIAAHEAGLMSDEACENNQKTLNNPYLTAEFLKALQSV